MIVGVPTEIADGERRVALVPEVVRKLTGRGLEVRVESGAGERAIIPDALYEAAGAKLADVKSVWAADVVVKVAPPAESEIAMLGSGTLLIAFLAPLTQPKTTRALAASHATAFAMESIPRISRAQAMDALSSQSNVSGYRAALLGAEKMGRFYPMLMTAAGTIPPAKVLVLGVGVAGLQALATARRLGAQTTGYDVRPEVAEQVQSLGAKWLDLGIDAAGEGGYARELTDDEKTQQQKALVDAIKNFDVVITTALVPGRPAPRLVTAESVKGMKAGSVIVDLAGESGGNCELTVPGETVVVHDVTISSPLNLPAEMPEHASQLYARNVSALLELFLGDDGELALDWDDAIISGAAIVRDGEIVNDRARATVEAAQAAEGTAAEPEGTAAEPEGTAAEPDGTQAKPEGTAAKPEGTAAKPEGTAAKPEGTAAEPEGTQAEPEGTAAKPEGTAAEPEGTAAEPEGDG